MTWDGRSHVCPACTKRWHCLAEHPPKHKIGGGTVRPAVECVYPDTLLCVVCVREEQPHE